MALLTKEQPGFLGFESAREEIRITVSYQSSLEAIRNWKKNGDHKLAQKNGHSEWYQSYKVRIYKVERDYLFDKNK